MFVTHFFADFPKETEANATFYKEYSHLSTFPADCIDTRARDFYLFNRLASKSLDTVRLNCSTDENFSTKKLRSAKMYFLYSMKWYIFNESLTETQRLSLFILCPNDRSGSGSNRDCWIPNVFPLDEPIPKKIKKQYHFVGQLLGMAIRKKLYFDLKFVPLVWKGLLNEEITLKDIESIDEQSFTMIFDLEKYVEQSRSIGDSDDLAYVFVSILDEVRFEVVNSTGSTYELTPGGSDTPITLTNFSQYCSSYRQYRLEEFQRQIQFIRQGNFDENHPLMQRFWNVFCDKLNDEQRRLFLLFASGRSTLPKRDEDFSSKFSITRYPVYNEDTNVDQLLPRTFLSLSTLHILYCVFSCL